MAATVILNRWTGPGGSETQTNMASGTTLAASDTHYALDSSTNAILVPPSGQNASYWAHFRLEVTVTGESGSTINNLRCYFQDRDRGSDDAAIGWLGQLANSGANAGYRQDTLGTVGETGTLLSIAAHTGLIAEAEDPLLWTDDSPQAMTGSISNPATGDFGDFIVIQRTLDDTYPSTAAFPNEVLLVEYDES